MSLILTKGDFGTVITLKVLNDVDKSKYNLTGCTVTGHIVRSDGTTKIVSFSITDAVNGESRYVLTALDTEVVGVCTIYVKINGGGVYEITSNTTVGYEVLPIDGSDS